MSAIDERFARSSFLSRSPAGRHALAHELATLLARFVAPPLDFHARVYEAMRALQLLGHDIWSFDETDDVQRWCARGIPEVPGISVDLSPGEVEVVWVESASVIVP